MKNYLRVAVLVVVFFVAYGLIGVGTAKAFDNAVSFTNASHIVQSVAKEPNAPADPNKGKVTEKGKEQPKDPNAPKDPNKGKVAAKGKEQPKEPNTPADPNKGKVAAKSKGQPREPNTPKDPNKVE